MKEFWDSRYKDEKYAYGEEPNEFLIQQLKNLTPGRILFPAEGEGRNAVYAAKLGWNVSAFDISVEGRNKAIKLSEKNNVTIDYQVNELVEDSYNSEEFDAIALIFAHFAPHIKQSYHKILSSFLKKGGLIIFEAFSKNHIKYNSTNDKVGGPKDIDTLCSVDEIKSYFPDFEVLLLEETETELNEGLYHIGTGSVVRFVGRKQ